MTRFKLLAVDDKTQNLFALEQLLRNLPLEVIKTTSPIKALELALEHDFFMAIVDVQMPEMDGYELVTLLRGYENTSHLPVIFVSAIYSDEFHHHQGYEAGAVDFLSKPFVPEILISKVKVFMNLYNQHFEMKTLIGQLSDANRRLSELNTEKERLIGIAAHDLRNPLGNILSLSEFMLIPNVGFPLEDQLDMVSDIYKQAKYMLSLIENVLDISQIEAGVLTLRTEAINVADFLSELINNHHQLAFKAKGSAVVLGGAPSVDAEFDPIRLRQVVDNLVTNAVKFSPPGHQTVVYVDPIENNWRFNVRDTGPGIPLEEQAKLFRYFSKISTSPTGEENSTGLGLAISAKIVQAHGGEIGVDSKPGEGATFWFTLPGKYDNVQVRPNFRYIEGDEIYA